MSGLMLTACRASLQAVWMSAIIGDWSRRIMGLLTVTSEMVDRCLVSFSKHGGGKPIHLAFNLQGLFMQGEWGFNQHRI